MTKYTDLHPQVLRKREQIANLEKIVALRQLLQAREQLNEVLEKYLNQDALLVAEREQIGDPERAAALQRSSEISLQPNVNELQKALEELADLLTTYTDLHPAVVAKRQQIYALRKALSFK